jgi:hypothetical protein
MMVTIPYEEITLCLSIPCYISLPRKFLFVEASHSRPHLIQFSSSFHYGPLMITSFPLLYAPHSYSPRRAA